MFYDCSIHRMFHAVNNKINAKNQHLTSFILLNNCGSYFIFKDKIQE